MRRFKVSAFILLCVPHRKAGFLFTSQETAKLHSNKADYSFPSNKSSLNNFLISGTYFSNCSFSFVFRKLRVCLAAYLMGPPTELHTFSWTHGQTPMCLFKSPIVKDLFFISFTIRVSSFNIAITSFSHRVINLFGSDTISTACIFFSSISLIT